MIVELRSVKIKLYSIGIEFDYRKIKLCFQKVEQKEFVLK